MRRDAKLGLALGMLVVGFATAFCFPRQPRSAAWVTFQEPEPIADSELDFLPIRAYQPAPAEAAPSLSSTSEEPRSTPSPVVPAPLAIGAEPFPEESGPDAPVTNDVDVGPTVAEHQHRIDQVDSGLIPATTVQKADSHTTQRYTIASGDTLTGISIKFYGTSLKYRRIFDANRGRISSVDSLKVGTEIVIPPKDGPLPTVDEDSAAEEVAEDQVLPTEDRSPESPKSDARFLRAAGAPFLSDRNAPQ